MNNNNTNNSNNNNVDGDNNNDDNNNTAITAKPTKRFLAKHGSVAVFDTQTVFSFIPNQWETFTATSVPTSRQYDRLGKSWTETTARAARSEEPLASIIGAHFFW